MGKFLKETSVEILDMAIAQGLEIRSTDLTKTSSIQMRTPHDFPTETMELLKDKAPEVRLLWKVRTLSEWLSNEHQQWQHGESNLDDEEFAEWIDLFVAGDKFLRVVYDFKGCIWGMKGGCNESSPTKYAPVLCEGCCK